MMLLTFLLHLNYSFLIYRNEKLSLQTCNICNQAFYSLTRLNIHVEGMHRNIRTDLNDILGKLMPSKPEENKLVSISDEKISAGFQEGCPYKCGICGNIF